MLLSQDYLLNNISKIQEESFQYLIVGTKNYEYRKDKDFLEPGIEIANLCNIIRMVNDTLVKVGAERIEFSILGEVLTAIYTGTPFNEDQLKDLYTLELKIEKTAKALESLSPMMEEFFVPSETIKSVIGFDFNKQFEFKEVDEEAFNICDDKYFEVHNELLEEKISLQEFKKKALELLESDLQKAKLENKK